MKIPAEPASTPLMANPDADAVQSPALETDDQSIATERSDTREIGDTCDSDNESLPSLGSLRKVLEKTTSRPVAATECDDFPEHPVNDVRDQSGSITEHASTDSSDFEVHEESYQAETNTEEGGKCHLLWSIYSHHNAHMSTSCSVL